MSENKSHSSGKKQSVSIPRKMTRNEALLTLGSVAAGIPFINRVNYVENKHSMNLSREDKKTVSNPVLAKAINELEYLTPADKFIVQRRGNPVLTEIQAEKLAGIGLTRETWKLEIVPDPESNSEIGNPLSTEKGNAIDWTALMKLAEKKAVRFLHVLSCTNSPKLYGMGLWEGVPLRDVFWMVKPEQNIRRIFFYGYHNDDPKQIFQASLPVSRILEEAPGDLPVILCYKLNGKYLSQAIGGPVRLIVPGLYSNRCIKWLQRIVVTNNHQANDTYAEANNDVESPIKTCARFLNTPGNIITGQHFAVTGLAQVGMSGLSKVQYLLRSADAPLPENDPYLANGEWHDAIILPPPAKWGSDLPDGKLPAVLQFDPGTGKPYTWPLTYAIVHWAALIKADLPGKINLYCRTIDGNGIAQPLPRPFGRSGTNRIEVAKIISNPA